MTPEEDATWDVLCLQYPNAAPFRNCGWEIYDDVKKLCPNKAKGTHSFYPSNGTQGIRDPTNADVLRASEEQSRFSPRWDDAALNAAFQQTPPDAVRTEVGSASQWPGTEFGVDGNILRAEEALATLNDGMGLSEVRHGCLLYVQVTHGILGYPCCENSEADKLKAEGPTHFSTSLNSSQAGHACS